METEETGGVNGLLWHGHSCPCDVILQNKRHRQECLCHIFCSNVKSHSKGTEAGSPRIQLRLRRLYELHLSIFFAMQHLHPAFGIAKDKNLAVAKFGFFDRLLQRERFV